MLLLSKAVDIIGIGIILHAEDERNDDNVKPAVMMIGDAGGAHVRTRATMMMTAGYNVRLLTPRSSETAGILETSSADWGVADFISTFPNLSSDIVHIHYACSIGAWAFAASADPRPLMVTVMGGDVLFDEQSQPSELARWLVKQVLRRADKLTVKSDYLMRQLIKLDVTPEKIETVMWGVDGEKFKAISGAKVRHALRISEQAKVIFSPRMLHRFYRIDVIIRALAKIGKDVADAHLLVSEYDADPAYKAECMDLATAMGIRDRVHFIGHVTPARMPAYYGASDVIVSIPPSDGFPQTVLEAMACGKPNVLANLPCFEGLLEHGKQAFFVAPNATNVGEGIQAVLEDSNLANRLQDGGSDFVARFGSLPTNVTNVSRMYQELARQSVSKPLPIFVRALMRAILIGKSIRDYVMPLRQMR